MSDQFIPSNPIDIVFRPLTKGMISDGNPAVIPDEASLTLDGYRVEPKGPTRRPAWIEYANGVQTAAEAGALYNLVPAWKTDGTQYNGLLTEKYLYAVGIGSLTRFSYGFATGHLSQTTSVLTASTGLYWSAGTGVLVGDYVVLSGSEMLEIGANNISTLTMTSVPTTTYGSCAYVIRKVFHPDETTKLDTTVLNNRIVIADGTRTLYTFNGTTLSNYLTTGHYVPSCVVHFKDRLWVGNTKEAGLEYRHRIRWSGVAGDPRTFAAADYLDLEYAPGELLRLLPLGNLLIAYFADSIWYGAPTNLTDLPYAFDRIDTAGTGLVGPYAVTFANGGHWLVGDDNIYFLPSDPRQGLQPIGDPILSESLKSCTDTTGVYVVSDPINNRILFGFPKEASKIARIFAYNYITKAWSYESTDAEMLANPLLDFTLTWNDLTAELTTPTWDTFGDDFSTWDSIAGRTSSRAVFRGTGRKLYEGVAARTADSQGVIATTLITKEIDGDVPDVDKTYLKLTVGLIERPSADLTFAVSATDDGGNSWTSLGDLTIASTARKSFVNFTFTGASVRFRLTSSSQTLPYTIASIVVHVAGRGPESDVE